MIVMAERSTHNAKILGSGGKGGFFVHFDVPLYSHTMKMIILQAGSALYSSIEITDQVVMSRSVWTTSFFETRRGICLLVHHRRVFPRSAKFAPKQSSKSISEEVRCALCVATSLVVFTCTMP